MNNGTLRGRPILVVAVTAGAVCIALAAAYVALTSFFVQDSLYDNVPSKASCEKIPQTTSRRQSSTRQQDGGGIVSQSHFATSRHTLIRQVFAGCVIAGLGAGGYFAGSGRFDYAAHYLAGAGGTLILIAMGAVTSVITHRALPFLLLDGRVITAVCTLASIGLGIVAEFVVFAAPAADLLDIVHQSLGAVLVGIVFVLIPDEPGSVLSAVLRGAVISLLGLMMVMMGAKFVGIF